MRAGSFCWEGGAATAPSKSRAAEACVCLLYVRIEMQCAHLGGCHCGRVRYRVTADVTQVSECNCSICTKKGFLHLIVPASAFELLSGQSELATYQFNTGIAKHHFCRHCGIHSFYVPRSDPDKIDVNARCLEGIDLASVEVVRFDGVHWEEAMRVRGGGE